MARAIAQIALLGALLLAAALARSGSAAAQEPRGPIYAAAAQSTATSVTVDYLRRALREAESANASALIITLSSGGGVLRDVRPLAAEIASASVPVVVYVAPEGTQAGVVGAMLLSAAHVSALSPGTSFGSAYPLTQLNALLSDPTRALVQDSVTDELRKWNAAQGRNSAWVERAVTTGALLTNEQAIALDPPAVNLVAANQEQLLIQLDGRMVKLADGRTVTLGTLGRSVTPITPTLWEELRLTLADPTIALVLLVLGALAVCLEFAAPGTTVFAGIGLVLLGAAALGFWVLPLHGWALLLVVGGLALIGAEFVVPSHGGFAVTGLTVLIVGALNLIDTTQAPGIGVAAWSVALLALVMGTFIGLGVWAALRSRARPVTTGREAMVGKLAEVRDRLDPDGMVFVDGALWQAISEDGPVERGDWVRVAAMHNLRLIVRPLEETGDRRQETGDRRQELHKHVDSSI